MNCPNSLSVNSTNSLPQNQKSENTLQINETNGIQTVSARELYKGLEITDRFNRWFDSLLKYGFEENQDFRCVKTSTQQNQYGGIKEIDDYSITLDMAKQICMLQRSELGKKYRMYLINLEKAWNSPEMVMKRALQIATERVEQLEKQCFIMQPKADFYDKVTDSKDTCDMKEVAKVLNFKNIGRNKLFEILRYEQILDKHNLPYQQYVDAGYFRVIESKWEDPDGDTHINLKTVVYQAGVDFIRKTVASSDIYLNENTADAAEKFLQVEGATNAAINSLSDAKITGTLQGLAAEQVRKDLLRIGRSE